MDENTTSQRLTMSVDGNIPPIEFSTDDTILIVSPGFPTKCDAELQQDLNEIIFLLNSLSLSAETNLSDQVIDKQMCIQIHNSDNTLIQNITLRLTSNRTCVLYWSTYDFYSQEDVCEIEFNNDMCYDLVANFIKKVNERT